MRLAERTMVIVIAETNDDMGTMVLYLYEDEDEEMIELQQMQIYERSMAIYEQQQTYAIYRVMRE